MTLDANTDHVTTGVVINVDVTAAKGEEEQARVRRPLDASQVASLELLAPNTIAVHRTDDDSPCGQEKKRSSQVFITKDTASADDKICCCHQVNTASRTVFVDDADARSVRVPRHPLHDGTSAVVDHFLEPRALQRNNKRTVKRYDIIPRPRLITCLVEHPYDYQARRIARRELLVHFIPRDDLDLAVVAVQSLVHGEVGRRCQAPGFGLFAYGRKKWGSTVPNTFNAHGRLTNYP